MAYAVTGNTTPIVRVIDGRLYYVWEITEAEAAAGSEFTLDRVPLVGTLAVYQAKLTSGTGTTIQPELGNTAAWTDSTIAEQGRISAAAAFINDASGLVVVAPAGKLYVRSTPNNAAADHAIATRIVIAAGVS